MASTSRSFGTILTIALVLLLAMVWGISYVRPLVLRVSRTPQDVWFLDASHGRLRLMQQRVTPATVGGLATDARTLHTITVRDSAGGVVATSRDPYFRDTRNPWWFDENGGNFPLVLEQGSGGAAIVDLRLNFLCAPLWFFVVLVMLPALITRAVRGAIVGRRVRMGRCRSCGYDLRASPERCPECGAVPQTRAAAAG